MSNNVFKVRYKIAIPDPDMPSPRWHHVIFVETQPDGGGTIHDVTGDITSGMAYAKKSSPKPENSLSYYVKDYLGTIIKGCHPNEVDRILAAQPPPPKQKHFNVRTMRTEQMKPDGTSYAPGETRPPMIKCTEWSENQAIPALYNSGVLRR